MPAGFAGTPRPCAGSRLCLVYTVSWEAGKACQGRHRWMMATASHCQALAMGYGYYLSTTKASRLTPIGVGHSHPNIQARPAPIDDGQAPPPYQAGDDPG
jgi:hypothetical protein